MNHVKKPRICLISPGHVASNPRLVKEADALYSAGYPVKVIAADITPAVRPFDQAILAQAPWSYQQVSLGSKLSYRLRRLRQKWVQSMISRGWSLKLWLACQAHSVMCEKLTKAALAEPADLYIAHYIAALPAAARAAQKYKAKVGFDAEDYHVGELADIPENRTEIAIRDFIERAYLPGCVHLTAASPLIAQAYAERYNVTLTPILNVFPLAEAPRPSEHKAKPTEHSAFSLYWFSQTIGPGRGLEEIVQVIAKMTISIQLFLRGSSTSARGFVEKLYQLAQAAGVAERIHVLPPFPPSTMAQLATEYDLGVSTELNQPLNRAICLTNKIFTYLLAGIPVLLSRTPAQEQLARQLGAAALLVDLYNPDETAWQLQQLLTDPTKLAAARQHAWRLGQERYNWDIEQKTFLAKIAQAFK